QRNREGEDVYAVPYDYIGACEVAPEACLGVPYFNWGPDYVDLVNDIRSGEFEPSWDWVPPNWDALNDLDSSPIGYIPGEGLSEEDTATLQEFIDQLSTGDLGAEEGFNLWTGPLSLQDGTEYVPDGEVATRDQIWYLPQLLQGMEGDSTAGE
ncbi:MAG: BMP family ABC transporter substrate-binding protein, partial [Anaerolineales bacterium]